MKQDYPVISLLKHTKYKHNILNIWRSVNKLTLYHNHFILMNKEALWFVILSFEKATNYILNLENYK